MCLYFYYNKWSFAIELLGKNSFSVKIIMNYKEIIYKRVYFLDAL